MSQDFDLLLLVEKTVEAATPLAKAKGIKLSPKLAPDVPLMVRGERQLVQNSISNMLGQAIATSSGGTLPIGVARNPKQQSPFALEIKVGDLVDQIDLESPRLDGNAVGAIVVSAATETAPLQILLAEDNPANVKLIVTLLQKQGHSVDVAEDGVQAVAQADAKKYDLILMDVRMPNKNGLDATRDIRSGSGPCQKQPIFALTANATEADREACLAAGMSGFLNKPLRARELYDILDHYSQEAAKA